MNLVRFTFPLLMVFLTVSSPAWSQETTDAAPPELILKASLGGKAYPRTLRFSEDGSIVWVNTLDAWNVETGEKIVGSPSTIRKISSPIIDIANKSMLIASRESGDLLLWPENGQPTERELSQSGELSAARLLDDGKRFALVFPDPPSVYFGRVDTDKDDSITPLPVKPYRCKIAPNGNLLAIRKDREVTIWDLKRGEKKSLLVHKHEPYSFAFSPDSRVLATGSSDNIVRIFNANDGEVLAEMSGHGRGDIFLPSAVYSLEFSPDGKRLASGGHDGRVIVWDVESHKPIMKVQIGGPPIVTAVSFSPDSASIACCFENAGTKRGVRVWRIPKTANVVDQLVGTWVTTKIISGGKKQEVEAKLEFTAEKCTITMEGQPPEKCSYSIETEKSPKHLGLVFMRLGKTVTLPAIFELEDGELKICHPLKQNEARPELVESNRSNVLFYCKRQKPDTPGGNAAANPNPANPPNQEVLGHGYTRGDGKIFFKGMAHAESLPLDLKFTSLGLGAPLAKDIDAASFIALSEQYSKDKNKVYLKWVGMHRFVMLELPNTDPGSFEALGHNLARDKNHVWWSHDVIANADPRTVQVLNPGFVWKDAKCVWYQRAPIKGADAKTFKHLNQAFYRDANRIYWSMTPIKEADLDSFRTFSNTSPYAADKNHVYMGTKQVTGLDPETFGVVHEQVYKDKNGVYVNGKPVRGASPGSVRKLADLDDDLSALITDGTSHYAFLPAWGEVYQVELQDSSIRVSREIFEGQGDSRQKVGETSVRLTADGWQDLKAPAKYKQHEAGVFSTFKPHFQKSWEVLSGEMVKIASTTYLTDIASSPGGNGYNLPDEQDYPLLRSYRATQRDFDAILRKWLKSNPDVQKQIDNGGSPDIAELFAIELFGYRESGLTKAELTRGMTITTKLATQSYAVQARRLRMPMPELPLLRDELIRQAALQLPKDGFADEQKRLSAAEQQIDPRIDVWRKHYPGFLWLEPADAKKLTGNVASKASKERLADLADLVRKIEGRKIELSKLSKRLLAEYRAGSLNVVQVELLTHLLTAEQKAHDASSAD